MANVTFLLLEQDGEQQRLLHACKLAAQHYRNRQRVLVRCNDKPGAEAFDELLWQQPSDAFVPHNLTGEGPANGAPVEIAWQTASVANRPILINLTDTMPEDAGRFRQIFDFVPNEADLKQQARERYKHYRAAGHQLATQAANSHEN